MFIRKEVLEKIKGFNEYCFLEDIELSLRMKRLKYKVVFEPKAITWQREPEKLSSFIRQRIRWSRGIFRIKKLKRQSNLKTWFSDLIHGVPYYLSPFGMVIGTILAIILFLNLPWLFVIPLILLFSFNIFMIVYSRVFYRESLKDLIYLPLWFLLNNIYSLILIPRAYLDEKRSKKIRW